MDSVRPPPGIEDAALDCLSRIVQARFVEERLSFSSLALSFGELQPIFRPFPGADVSWRCEDGAPPGMAMKDKKAFSNLSGKMKQ
jgi:hypothetical protein